jgi:Ca2+-binding EF-hand superfamily protein
MEDLKLVVGCLIANDRQNQSEITAGNVEELFHTIDQTNKGKISYEEFKTFYDTVLKSNHPAPSVLA